ncbi:MAG: hypothetical protein P8Q97_03865 [Myxococcota bacterium]|nr:hypothetical protein [Myxococcota bacterium]
MKVLATRGDNETPSQPNQHPDATKLWEGEGMAILGQAGAKTTTRWPHRQPSHSVPPEAAFTTGTGAGTATALSRTAGTSDALSSIPRSKGNSDRSSARTLAPGEANGAAPVHKHFMHSAQPTKPTENSIEPRIDGEAH